MEKKKPFESKKHYKTDSYDDAPINDVFAQFLQMLPDNKEFVFRFLDMFPFPVEIFAPDGTAAFLNQSFLKLHNIKDPGVVIGKYNLVNDPVCNDEMGLRAGIEAAFGENPPKVLVAYDVIAPIQDLVDRGVIAEKPFEKSYMDFYLYPVKEKDKLAFVVFVCIVKKLYHGRSDLAVIKEYLDTHWQKEYDSKTLSKLISTSVTRLYKLFKEHAGMTPGEYHRKVKIEHIKEELANKNQSIKEAFSACGEDSRDRIARVFKKITGKSPKEYRDSL